MEMRSLVGRNVLVQFRVPYCMGRRDGEVPLPMGIQTPNGAYEYVQVPFLAGELIERDGVVFVRYRDDRKNLVDATFAPDLVAFVTVLPSVDVAVASGVVLASP